MPQTPEVRLMNEIKLYCGQHNWLCFHLNVGLFYTRTGVPIKTDLPEGWPDLMVVSDFGKVAYVETKIYPRKPTRAQMEKQQDLRNRGFLSDTVYSLDEFIMLVKDWENL